MDYIASIGAIVEVTPGDEIWIKTSSESAVYVDDRSPFRFRVDKWLEDGQIFFGLCGDVVSGHERYLGLLCNIFLRFDGSDWRKETRSGAAFKVGKSPAVRVHEHSWLHPEGTRLEGFPVIGRYGSVSVINQVDPNLERAK